MTPYTLIAAYFAAVNLVAFLSFGIDKSRSKRAKWRIPEATLMAYALFGGSLGCFLGMRLFRHKTLKPLFYIGVPIILVLQVLGVLWLIFLSPFRFTVQ